MTTSGSDNFVATRDQIVGDALANVGAVGPNETPEGDMLAHGARLLNDLVKSIDAEGEFLWRMTRPTITTIAATAGYALSATFIDIEGPMRFLQAGSTSGTIIEQIQIEDYMRIPNRTQQSRTPMQFAIQTDLASDGRVQKTVYMWPVPSTSGDTAEYRAFTRGEDFDTGANNPDFPQSWITCLKWGLSMLLAPSYRQFPLVQGFRDLFESEKAKLINADNQHGNLQMVPFGDFGGYSSGR